MSDGQEKTIRIITFSGKQKDWRMWSAQFLARANRKGFKNVLLGKMEVPSEDEEFDIATTTGKEKLMARQANEAA